MTLEEAIRTRHSVRQYTEQPIEAEKIQQLQDLIDECNREGDLHIQLVTDEPKAFASGIAHYSKFRGVRNYIAMIAKKGDDINLGYYGEKVVLLAQCLGLNTCWVAKFVFILHDNNKVEAQTRFTLINGYAPIDLGIAKCHFEIGAGKENFQWM